MVIQRIQRLQDHRSQDLDKVGQHLAQDRENISFNGIPAVAFTHLWLING
jgi:hypothetical protein